eukprot:37023-Hanusia_phi.AAC.1
MPRLPEGRVCAATGEERHQAGPVVGVRADPDRHLLLLPLRCARRSDEEGQRVCTGVEQLQQQ